MKYEQILKITQDFYDKATNDILIGFHFRNIDDFDSHIPRIASFWELQLAGKITDKSQLPFDLIQKHIPLKATTGQLSRWIVLFEETLEKAVSNGEIWQDDRTKWLTKIQHFRQKFLSHPLLFAKD